MHSNKKVTVGKLPYFRQKTNFMCGPASLQMMMSFLGEHKTQDEIVKKAGTSKKKLKEAGMNNGDLIKAGRLAGFYVYANEDALLAEIKYFIDLKMPVLVNYREPSENDGHFAVVAGYDWPEKKLILNDPWNGKNFIISEKSFLNRWHGSYQGHTRWLMVLSNKPFSLGKQFMPLTKKARQ